MAKKRPTRLQSFINKYGPEMGPYLLSRIAKVAAQARWKAYYRDRVSP